MTEWVKTRDLPRHPAVASADVASFAPGVCAGSWQARARAQVYPIAGGDSPLLRRRPPHANAEKASGTNRLKTIAAAVLAVMLVLVAGCGGDGRGRVPERGEGSSAKEIGKSSSVLEPRGGVEAASAEDGRWFGAGAEMGGGEAGAADRIEGVRFRICDDYERLLIDFGRRGGRPAGVPRWSVESPADGGYVRVRFPGVTSTEMTDEDFVGSELDELYVVRDRGGGLFADAFAMHASRYRVTELPESGRLAVDFRGVREELEHPPTTSDKVVVLQPREAEKVGSPLMVQGYARLFEGQVTISLLDRDQGVISSRTVRANDWTTAWGLFAATLEYSGYKGLATLRVGSNSPRDGSFVGTETEIFLE
jgi:hypothetical protein